MADTPSHASAADRGAALALGDLVLLVDNRKRRYLVRLAERDSFQSHAGVLAHDDLVGRPEGCQVSTTRGQRFRVFRPSLEDYILAMPRGAQIIYPKDIAPMLMLADVGPGMTVFESGVGSGALSLGLLRAGAFITGYELREDFAARAVKNVAGYLGDEALDRYDVSIRSAYDGIEKADIDRVVLDLPEPWQVVPHAERALRPGGILVAYTPSITQAIRLRQVLETTNFIEERTMEVLHRSWHIEGQAVRPDHRMVAHTAFLTRARLLAPS